MNDDASPSYASTMLAGAAAGALPRVVTHPLDTCKARIQVRTPSASVGLRAGLVAEIGRTARGEGIRALYRGFPTAFWGAAPAGCLYFGAYEASKALLSPGGALGGVLGDSSTSVHLLSGLLAEAASCVLWVPIDVVKERLQVQSTLYGGAADSGARSGAARSTMLYRGNVDAFKSILSTEGVRGLYRGYGATLLSFGPFSAIFFALNEQFKAAWMAHDGVLSVESLAHPTLAFATSGAAAGSIAAFATNPMDMAKLRLQVQRRASALAATDAAGPSAFGYRGLFHGMAEIVRHEGPAALFKGAFARVAFQAPTTTIAITSFETLRLQFARVV